MLTLATPSLGKALTKTEMACFSPFLMCPEDQIQAQLLKSLGQHRRAPSKTDREDPGGLLNQLIVNWSGWVRAGVGMGQPSAWMHSAHGIHVHIYIYNLQKSYVIDPKLINKIKVHFNFTDLADLISLPIRFLY